MAPKRKRSIKASSTSKKKRSKSSSGSHRRTKKTAKRKSNASPDPFARLPPEIIVTILKNANSIDDLKNMCKVSPRMREICRLFRRELRETVLIPKALAHITNELPGLTPAGKTQALSILRTFGKTEPRLAKYPGYNYESDYFDNKGKYQDLFESLQEKFVPAQGAASTKQGNLLRAMSALNYRFFNDGDREIGEQRYLFDHSRPQYTQFELPGAVRTIVVRENIGGRNLGRGMNASVRHIIEGMVELPKKKKKGKSRSSSMGTNSTRSTSSYHSSTRSSNSYRS